MEAQLEKYFERSALLFNSGYAANSGIIPALTDKKSIIYSDAYNHASIIDGCRLSAAKVEVFRHNNIAELSMKMAKGGPEEKWIVTESVFSMEGDLAPLTELRILADKYNAKLCVDEAHAVGWAGNGRGLSAKLGIRPDVVVGTFGKSFGSYGAFCLGEPELIQLLLNQARTFVFTTGMPAPILAASIAALAYVRQNNHLQESLANNCALMAKGLRDLGLPANEDSPIFPVTIGEESKALEAASELRNAGFFCQAIRPPTVPEGTSRLRATIRADHRPEQISNFCGALGRTMFHVEHRPLQ